MCVIIYHQRKHKTIPLEKLQNAIHNNPHGIGLIRFGQKRNLIIRKSLPKDLINGPNAEELHTLLKQYEKHSYILHLRHTTVGTNTVDNLHPFELVKTKNNGHYVFLHNGTLHEFAEANAKRSDTFKFCQEIVQPLANLHSTAKPETCLTYCETIGRIIEKYRTTHSRFMLISGDKRIRRWGTWTEKDWGLCSNDDYFNSVVRGPHQKKTGTGYSNKTTSATTYPFQQQKEPTKEEKEEFWNDQGFLKGPRFYSPTPEAIPAHAFF